VKLHDLLTYLWILTATFSKKKLHGFMLQIIYTTVFRAKRLNNRTRRDNLTVEVGKTVTYKRPRHMTLEIQVVLVWDRHRNVGRTLCINKNWHLHITETLLLVMINSHYTLCKLGLCNILLFDCHFYYFRITGDCSFCCF
jgi:hypothetical protein